MEDMIVSEYRLRLAFSRRQVKALLALTLLGGLGYALKSVETMRLSTYYPAPSGVYKKIITTAQTILARDAAFNVGIGTTNPRDKLDILGTLRLSLCSDSDSSYCSAQIMPIVPPALGLPPGHPGPHGGTIFQSRTIPGTGEASWLFHFKTNATADNVGRTRADVLVDGKIRMGKQTVDADSDDTVVTKGYLKSVPGVGLKLLSDHGIQANICPGTTFTHTGAAGTVKLCSEPFMRKVTFKEAFTKTPHVILMAEDFSYQPACVGGATDKVRMYVDKVTPVGFEVHAGGSPFAGACSPYSNQWNMAEVGYLAIGY